jgi:nicotinamide riboside transporter PnuC
MVITSWIATILAITGALLNARKMISGYWVWILSNAIWLVLSLIRKDYAQSVLWAVYIAISSYGIYCWMKDDKK